MGKCDSAFPHNKQMNMNEYIKQNGKVILSGDNISIPMIFHNLSGANIKETDYIDYIRYIAIPEMGFTSGRIEYWQGNELKAAGEIPKV